MSPDSKSVANPAGSVRITSPSNATPKVLYPGTPSPVQTLYTEAASSCPSFGVPMQELRAGGVQPCAAPMQVPQPSASTMLPHSSSQAPVPASQVMYLHQQAPPAAPFMMDGGRMPAMVGPEHSGMPNLMPAHGQALGACPAAASSDMVGAPPMGDFPSAGSALHDGTGRCSPCAWFWKPRGCQSGASCGYCHLCPEGELKSRKKAKVAAIRMGALEPTSRGQNGGRQPGTKTNLKLTTLL